MLRYPKVGKKPGPNDNQWTLGKVNLGTGYPAIASIRVHSIIATAFHGLQPTPGHVVDHIDTNKRNNRPDNLRWVTRLENLILNPITAKRISAVCGSVETFLADPTKFRDKFLDQNYSWMTNVNAEEAQISLQRMLSWAQSDAQPSGGSLGDWIFNRNREKQKIEEIRTIGDLVMAKTSNAAQRDWRTPSEFPCCPQLLVDIPIKAYSENLLKGAVFCRNDLYTTIVSEHAVSIDSHSIFVITETNSSEKPWGLAKITFENNLFVHTSLSTFFTKDGVDKQFYLAQGLPWHGPESIDDFA